MLDLRQLAPDKVEKKKHVQKISKPARILKDCLARKLDENEIRQMQTRYERLASLQLITSSKSSSATCAQQEGEGLVVAAS